MGVVLLGAASIPGAGLLLWWAVSGERLSAARRNLHAGMHGGTADLRAALLARSGRDRVVDPWMGRALRFARRFTPSGVVDQLEHRVLLAGASSDWSIDRLLAGKLLLAAAGALFGFFWLATHPGGLGVLVAAVATVLGYFVPDLLLTSQAQKRRDQIQLALPDTLDQITISVGAGLGLEAAMARVARTGDGPLAQELTRTLQDMRAGMSRATALRGMSQRTEVPDLNRIVLALLQADSYGVPISRVLRIQADELRVKRRQRAEEKAMKLPVKVLFPLVVCILPTMFIVLLGPAGIRIMRMFSR